MLIIIISTVVPVAGMAVALSFCPREDHEDAPPDLARLLELSGALERRPSVR